MSHVAPENIKRTIRHDELSSAGRLALLDGLVRGGAVPLPHGVTEATQVTGIRITAEQYDMAHAVMTEDLGRRQDAVLPAERTSSLGAERHLTSEEVAEGKAWYDYIEKAVVPQPDGVNFRLTAKFHSKANVQGIDKWQKEWQTIIPGPAGGYQETTYRSQSADFLFASAVQQSVIGDQFAETHPGTNLLVMYPSPNIPEQTVCSYGMVFDPSNFPENERNRAPAPDFVSLDFEIPTMIRDSFMRGVHDNPRRLEALLQATPYGTLMHSTNTSAPIVRMPAKHLAIVQLESGAYQGSMATEQSRRVARHIGAAVDAAAVPYDPPIAG